MTKASTANRIQGVIRGPMVWTSFRLALSLLLFQCVGCISMPWGSPKKIEAPQEPADSLVLRAGGLEKDVSVDAKVQAELDSAKRLYQEKEYAKAEVIFNKIEVGREATFKGWAGIGDTYKVKPKNLPLQVVDDALYYEAACQFYQTNYRAAEATFRKYIKEFRTGVHADEANRRLFEIANYWLDDTRKLMQAYEEQRQGKRYIVMPVAYAHFGKDMPFLDAEGHALQCLEDVRLNDLGGPLGEKSLFYIATIKFFREDYQDADYYYSQLYENYPNSPLAPKAIKQAIICKQLSTGGSCYDCRPVEESRKLIDVAQRAYPQLVSKDQEWISRQLVGINLQQADRDFNIAEYYRRVGHPGSAYFYYELVIRRYPNTDYAEKAKTRKDEMHDKVVQEQKVAAAKPPGSSANPVAAPIATLQRLFSPNSNPAPANNPAPMAAADSTPIPATIGAPTPIPQSLPTGMLKN